MSRFVAAACSFLLFGSFLQAESPIPCIGPVGDIKQVQTDFQFTEGPAQAPDGTLYFTDIPADRIYQRTPDGEISVFLEPSGHCNGLMVTADGTLYACSMDGRMITIDRETKKITPLTEEYEGNRYNAPNDLVVDQQGGVYFTDPHFRAPTPLPQKSTSFYYCDAQGKVTRLSGDPKASTGVTVTDDGKVIKLAPDLKAPNGIILSPDEKTLYVIPSLQEEMWAYPVISPGKLGPGKVFCKLKQPEGRSGGGGDGLTVDTKGNLYITSGLGLQVFSPDGKHLGTIEFPEQPANVTFGGPEGKTLFVTARKSLYSVEMEAVGHQFPGKK
jgi:gluconolactonase